MIPEIIEAFRKKEQIENVYENKYHTNSPIHVKADFQTVPGEFICYLGEQDVYKRQPLIALSLMLFVLIYFPCIATISAIVNESGSWKWGIFVIVYTCVLAWIVSFVVYQTGSLFINLIN